MFVSRMLRKYLRTGCYGGIREPDAEGKFENMMQRRGLRTGC